MRSTGSGNGKLLLLLVGGGVLVGLGLLHSGGSGSARLRYASGGWVSADQAPAPLVATVTVASRGGYLVFQPVLADADGRRITRMGGRKPPRLEVYNDSGTLVHSAKMRYG